jgi:tetratricopeptide (TPR) repeat protein
VIAEHVASCEACYFVFTETARMKLTQGTEQFPERPKPAPTPMWRRPQLLAGLAAAAMLIVAVNVWGPFGSNADRRALDRLVTAVGTARTFDPRLTGGFAYAPVRGAVRGSNDTPQLSPDIRIAIAEIEKQNAARPVAASAALISGDANRAIDILEAASKNALNDARIFSDLSAAYLVRAGQRTDNARDLQMALANANRALEIERLMPEALFNRALALQMLGQNADARTAWQSFLTIDDRSGWADEARVRLRILSTQP